MKTEVWNLHKILNNAHAYTVAIHNSSNTSADCISKNNGESKSEKVRIIKFKHTSKFQLKHLNLNKWRNVSLLFYTSFEPSIWSGAVPKYLYKIRGSCCLQQPFASLSFFPNLVSFSEELYCACTCIQTSSFHLIRGRKYVHFLCS